MHVVLCAYGTLGNVLPFIGWGRALRARGHQVTFVSQTNLAERAEREGFEFVGVGPFPSAAGSSDENATGIRAKIKLVRAEFEVALRNFHQHLVPAIQQPDTVVAAPFWIIGARIACETHRVPLASIYLQPRMLPTDGGDAAWLRPFYRGLQKFRWAIANRLLGKQLNRYRRELSLPPEWGMIPWWNSPERILAFFPEWFAPRQPEWPQQLRYAGFPLFDGWVTEWQHEELDRFLAAGDPPLIFSQSSNVGTADEEYLRVSMEAAKRLGRRAVILTTHPELLPNPLPDHVRYFGIIPLSAILPRSAAFIHHGGMGSLAQAIAAGVPQLTTPWILDQPDNCRHLAKLGVSRTMKPRQYRVDRVVAELKSLLESRDVQTRCRELSRQLPTEEPFAVACDELEQLLHGAALPVGR